jgi:hypothetical protein
MTEGNYYKYKFKRMSSLLAPVSMNFLSFIVQYVNVWKDIDIQIQDLWPLQRWRTCCGVATSLISGFLTTFQRNVLGY